MIRLQLERKKQKVEDTKTFEGQLSSMEKKDFPPDIEGVMDGSRAFIGPEQVVVDITNRCNNNCIACWTGSPLLRDKAPPAHWKLLEFPYELMKEIIDDLYKLGTKRIRFTGGGEPFMHPNLMDLVAYVKSLGMICSLTTNFTLVDHQTVDRLIELGVDEIAVSLWAGDAVTYARVHPNKTEKTFDRIERLLFKLGTEKNGLPKVTIANVLFNMNFQNAPRMFDLAKKIRADAIYFTLVDPIPGYTDSLLLAAEQRTELLHMMEHIESKAGGLSGSESMELENLQQFKRRLSNPDADGGHYDNNIIDSIPCYIGWMFCRLLPDGRVSPCCRGVNKPMGNLFQNSFEEIWNSKTYCTFRHHAKYLRKTNPYFHPIGCDTMCDNLMHNMDMHKRILALDPSLEKELTHLKKS